MGFASPSIDQLKPTLDAIQKINRQAVGYDDVLFGKIEEFKTFLLDIYIQYQAVVEQGNLQYQNRDESLINKAAMRVNQIPRDIEKIKTSLDWESRARKSKAEELKAKGFTNFETNQVVKPITQDDIDASNATIEALKVEAKLIEAFLADSPRFDKEFLRGSSVYPVEADLKAA